MRHDHVPFETMCVLAAGDQLPQDELVDVRDHCADCDACNERLLEMKKMGAELFLIYALQESDRRAPKGMRDRFLLRANCEGIPLKPRAEKLISFSMSLLSAVALLVITITVVSSWHNLHSTRTLMTSSNRVSGSKDIVGREVSLSRADPRPLQTRGTVATTVGHRRLNTGSREDESDEVPSPPQSHESSAATKTPHVTLVMYTPQPRVSSDSISTTTLPITLPPLTRTYRSIYPAFPSVNGKKIVEIWIQRDASMFAQTFLLNKELALSECFGEARQSPAQDASLPNGTFNCRLIQSDFRIP